jgi:hypothetical protein
VKTRSHNPLAWPLGIGYWPTAAGQQPSFIYFFSVFFLMGFSSIVFIYLLSCIKEVNTQGGSFSACELGTKVPSPLVLKQPLDLHTPYSPTIPHSGISFVFALMCMTMGG